MIGRRAWINQPSILQPLHELHEQEGIAIQEPYQKGSNTYTFYFSRGPIVSMEVFKQWLVFNGSHHKEI